MVKYRYLGSGTTNENGVATYTYTGVGAGNMEIVASTDSTISDDSLISNARNLMDCIVCDVGITEDYNDVFRTMGHFTRGDSSTNYSYANSTSTKFSNYLSSAITFSGDVGISMEILATNTTTARLEVARSESGMSTTYNNMLLNSPRSVRIELREDYTYWYSNNNLIRTDRSQPNTAFNLAISTDANTTSDFNYNNLMIYPI